VDDNLHQKISCTFGTEDNFPLVKTQILGILFDKNIGAKFTHGFRMYKIG